MKTDNWSRIDDCALLDDPPPSQRAAVRHEIARQRWLVDAVGAV